MCGMAHRAIVGGNTAIQMYVSSLAHADSHKQNQTKNRTRCAEQLAFAGIG